MRRELRRTLYLQMFPGEVLSETGSVHQQNQNFGYFNLMAPTRPFILLFSDIFD